MDPMVGRDARNANLFSFEFESLGWDEKSQQDVHVGHRERGRGGGGNGVDTIDGGAISLHHKHKQQTLQYHRAEHKVCVFLCVLYVLWCILTLRPLPVFCFM